MQQHQSQLRLQQHQQQLRPGAQQQLPVRVGQQQQQQQFPNQQQGTNYQSPGNAPSTGTTAQTGFVNDGNFSPATGHSQQSAGMPYKSANQPNMLTSQITSTTNNQEIGKKSF